MTNYSNMPQQHSGQALLLLVLLLTAVLTVGLSLVARNIANVRMATEESEAQRALSAAEAGLEQTLLTDNFTTGTFLNNASFDTTVVDTRSSAFLLNNGRVILKDEGADVWLSDYSPDPALNYANKWTGQISIYWGAVTDACRTSEGINTMAAMEVIVISGSEDNPTIHQFTADPCAARRGYNDFNNSDFGSYSVAGTAFVRRMDVVIPPNGIIARVIPLYANATIGITSATDLPKQGTIIESVGSAGEVQRKISVFRENPSLPIEFFGYSLLQPI